MANPATNPTPPDAKQPAPTALIPQKSIAFLPTMNLPIPGLPQGSNGTKATDPCAQGFTRIGFDPRSQRFRVMFFKPGPDLNRAPSEVREYPAAICISEPLL